MSIKRFRFFSTFCLVVLFWGLVFSAGPAAAAKVAVLEIDINSYQVQQALKNLELPATIESRLFTEADLSPENQAARDFIVSAELVFVNVMSRELPAYLEKEKLIVSHPVYALNRAGDPEKLKAAGIICDDEIQTYYHNRTVANLVNLIRFGVRRHIDATVNCAEPVVVPEICLRHPEAPGLFTELESYLSWDAARPGYDPKAPRVGIMFYGSTLKVGQVEAADAFVRRLEAEGFRVLPLFGPVTPLFQRWLRPEGGRAPVDLLLAFSMKFSSGINDEIRAALKALNVPLFDVIRPFAGTLDEWRRSPIGLGPMETVWAVATPEFSGAIEPSVLIGKREFVDPESGRPLCVYETIDETIDSLLPRLKKWVALQRLENADKKVAIIYYNHSQGKQNIGAAYLNVFRSLQEILTRMRAAGYQVSGAEKLTEEKIKKLVLASGRNIGSWAPGELDELLLSGEVEQVPLAEYRRWFDRLPEAFKKPVLKQWGEPEKSSIMTKDGKLVFPMVKLGNIVLLPEPARGWSDEPMKLYHDTTLYPHHQYIAAYLWLAEKFKADAMVHLGTHATYEWLPGKQVGLAPADPPEIMVGDIPNIYPYIVDDVGEGIQAKRRGRGVVLDYLTPPMREADLYHEYNRLHDLFHKHEVAAANGSETVTEYRTQIHKMIKELGLAADLRLNEDELDDKAMEKIHLYLHEIDGNSLPYGLHTYGKADDPEAVEETIRLILKQNPDAAPAAVRRDLEGSPVREMDNFIRALNGEYIPAGEGNDPLRNLAAIPTGKNFYGFSPAKVPSKAAWEIGKRAAEKMIADKLKKTGKYPNKVGVVLWATETTRNEGVHESTILWLMGVEPVWDATERVVGSRVVPGAHLKRPRIDVLINPSGLYRDMFPNKLIFLDEAVQKAMAQTDIENLIAKNRDVIKTALLAEGLSEEEAETRSRFRIFTEEVGSYGNGVSEMTAASGLWDADEEVSNVYLNRVQFAIGQGQWGVPVKKAFVENLRGVDIAVHSRSSNVIGIIDTDDFFQYLGGLSLAVKNVRGEAPDTLVTMHRRKDELMVEEVAKTIGREMRTRYLNPKWIEGMKRENYAGARQMADFANNLWGWQVTVPDAVGGDKWNQIYQVYVDDKYDLDLKEFFNQHSPWAYQSMTARMLDVARKDYWQPSEEMKRKLAAEYAVSVVEKGVACCDHTCNNPQLNQMVANLISLPGVVAPEIAAQFKLAIEKMAGKTMEEQVADREALLQELTAAPGLKEPAPPEKELASAEDSAQAPNNDPAEKVEGYKMEDIKTDDRESQMSSSGIQWAASLFIVLLLVLFFIGSRRRR